MRYITVKQPGLGFLMGFPLGYPLLLLLVTFSIPKSLAFAQWNDLNLTLVSGESVTGSITSIDSEGVIIGTGLPAGLKWQDVARVNPKSDARSTADSDNRSSANPNSATVNPTQGISPAASKSAESSIRLANGSLLLFSRMTVQSEMVKIESSIGISELPLQIVTAIVWSPCPLIEEQLKESNSSEDRVIVSTPDGDRVVKGLLEEITDSQVQIQYQNQARKINLNKVKGLVMADVGIQSSPGAVATLRFEDGSIVKGVLQSMAEGQLELALFDSVKFKFAQSAIRDIQIQSDRLLYLSDAEPVNVEQRTQFTVKRDWQRNLSVEKNKLSLRDSKNNSVIEYDKGLGTQAFTQLDFANSGDYQNFQATVGIDSETRGRGDCQMMVQGDGVVLWSGQVKGTDSSQEINVSIKGTKLVSLIVYPGEMFDLADHANWCNARFTK